jgi:hypothetical protein
MTPGFSATSFGKMFLTGYGYGAEARSCAEAEERLEDIPRQFRGFAYEGAAMSFTLLDAIPLGGGGRFTSFLAGRASDHVYMAYIGAGWAMARLPAPLWSRITAPDPLLRWLVLDGYGFHQAYFHTGRYVHERFQPASFRWPPGGPAWYANRVIDQGIGRAMWFVAGADAELAATMVDRFPEPRRGDLYSGAGLAACYAGGAGPDELRRFMKRAGSFGPQVAQGAAFAAAARVQAGLVTPHTELASEVLCGMTPDDAAQVCALALPDLSQLPDDGPPAYEVWRQRIASEAVSRGATAA